MNPMTSHCPPAVLCFVFSTALSLPGPITAEEALPIQTGQIALAAEALRPQLVALRRDFHQHPELGNCEERTARVVAEHLRALGLDEVRTNVAGHGVVALLRGGRPGPVVAVRAEMDALPITETNNLPYHSLVPGVMHACGHDAHTAIVLGVADLLNKFRRQLPGTVKFLFQPAEENAPSGEADGAVRICHHGCGQ